MTPGSRANRRRLKAGANAADLNQKKRESQGGNGFFLA